MCPSCWALVPKSLQNAVYAAFNPAQCKPGKDRLAPTPLWHMMADLAILASAAKRSPNDVMNQAARDAKARGMLTLVFHFAVEEADEQIHFSVTCNNLYEKALAAVPADLQWLRDALTDSVERIKAGEF